MPIKHSHIFPSCFAVYLKYDHFQNDSFLVSFHSSGLLYIKKVCILMSCTRHHEVLLQVRRSCDERGSRLNQLVADHEALQRLHQQLSREYDNLVLEHNNLKSEHKTIKLENKDLKV